MSNNTITTEPTTPQMCRYTTLRNVKCLQSTMCDVQLELIRKRVMDLVLIKLFSARCYG